MSENYQIVGQNNRNLLVQSKRVAPYHEDLTTVQQFEPAQVNPGHWTRVKVDFKHSTDREIILNDIRLEFELDFSARNAAGAVGTVGCVRGTDLIREMIVKINEDVVFKVDQKGELTLLYMMNNHRTVGEPSKTHDAYLLHHGIIPQGHPIAVGGQSGGNYTWDDTQYGQFGRAGTKVAGLERFDGRPRVIYDSTDGYIFRFSMSLNQLIGPIFHRLHIRRLEYASIDLRFEPWVSTAECSDFLLFMSNPVSGTPPLVHPYSVAQFRNIQIRQYRTTLLDGIQGFTLPDSRMLSWLMHRYSRREYSFNFDTQTFLDIQLHDWEIRTNITRVYWMIAPRSTPATMTNDFKPLGEPCEGYDTLCGVEIRWKNDKVLDLAETDDVYRHYALSENKRHGMDDPFITFQRILDHSGRSEKINYDGTSRALLQPEDGEYPWYAWINTKTPAHGVHRYEFPVYHVDLNMNVHHGVPGAEVVGGIVNDTSDYVIRIKRLNGTTFRHSTSKTPNTANQPVVSGERKIWVFIEYQTLVNLSGNSNQFARGSQIVTKQLNLQ